MSAAGAGGGEGAGAGGRRWETELPGAEELTPLSTTLISRTLARAFRIPAPAEEDVARASNSMLQLLRRRGLSPPRFEGPSVDPYEPRARGVGGGDGGAMPTGAEGGARGGGGAVLDRSRKLADAESEDVDSADGIDSGAARTLKRPRLVWTSQLHKRFVDAVGHLGIKNAVPKTIMQLMNVEGLTRENVASHLQKYRLYLKRMQGQSADGDSASDPLFASTPMPLNPTTQHLLPAPQHSRARANENPGPFSAPLPQHFLSTPQHSRARENEILLPFSAPQAQHFLSAPQYSRARENENSGQPFSVPVPRPQGILHEQSEAARAMAAAHGGAVHHFNKYNLQNLQQSYSFGVPQRAAGNLPRDLSGNAQSSQPDQSSPSHRELTLFPPSGH